MIDEKSDALKDKNKNNLLKSGKLIRLGSHVVIADTIVSLKTKQKKVK